MYVKENLDRLKYEIKDSMMKSGRNDEVLLLAVTKTFSNELVAESLKYGITDIAENKVQELVKRIEYFKDSVKYHQIGPLQTNKVKYIYKDIKLIHSLDRLSLAHELQKRASKDDIFINCLIQVNTSLEDTKSGLLYNEVIPFIENILEYDRIKVTGLMTMAPFVKEKDKIRKCFRELYCLKEQIEDRRYSELNMQYLSMGMSNDFKIAIEEGANILRIGSALYGKRNYNL